MSNIYIQEPPTEGKICLETTAGDIDIELWSREAPKACRNFVQLCMEGYYEGTIFHRMVKNFIVQGGDPTGTGTGGNSIWGKPFKDEFHSRLRFMRRGLVAMANAGRDDNGSQFFFTLGQTPELQNKHTIFGKVGGNTVYNMLKLEEGLTDENEKPLYPHKIIKARILSNPFTDIVPRETIKKSKDDKRQSKSKAAATKNYKLLSFGEEAEEDEEEVDEVNKQYSGKSKSSHDLANDPKLSKEPALESSKTKKSKRKSSHSSDSASENDDNNEEASHKKKKQKEDSEDEGVEEKSQRKEKEKDVQSVRDKLKQSSRKDKEKESDSKSSDKTEPKSKKKDEEESEEEYYLGKDEKMEQKRKVEELRKEYKELRKSIKREQKVEEKEVATATKEAEEKAAKLAVDNNVIKEFMDEQQKYKQVKAKAPKKGEDREKQTLAMLAKFKSKIETAKETFGEKEPPPSKLSTKKDIEEGEDDEEDDEGPDDISWLAKKLQNENKDEVLAKDANTKSDDWFDIHDPRNALTKRRREKGSHDSKEKKRARINN